MCKSCNHNHILILTTPGVDHEIFMCEECNTIIGTSDDFVSYERENCQIEEKIYWIKKPVDNILVNIS